MEHKFNHVQQAVEFVSALDDVRNLVVILRDTQVFGWPAGRSDHFTREAGRATAFVSEVIDTTPDVYGVGYGTSRHVFSSKEELLALLAGRSSEFVSVLQVEELTTRRVVPGGFWGTTEKYITLVWNGSEFVPASS